MSVIFELPLYSMISVLSEWIPLNDFCHLDSAICSRNQRLKLINNVKRIKFAEPRCEMSMKWMIKKSISAEQMIIDRMIHLDDNALESPIWQKLDSLQISGNVNSIEGFRVISKCVSLRRITLSNKWNSKNSVTNKVIDQIADHCKFIAKCDFSFCTKITDSCVRNLISGCDHLYVLILTGCQALTDTSFLSMANKRNSDTSLCLSVVHIDQCPKITVCGVETVVKHCSRLIDLAIGGVNSGSLNTKQHFAVNDAATPGVSQHASQAITSHCPGLISLRIEHTACSDQDISRLVSVCTLLQALSIAGNTALTDSTLLAIAQHSKLLQAFSAGPNKQFTVLGLQALCRANRHSLINLRITDCPQLTTNFTLCTIAPYCSGLKCLYLSKASQPCESGLTSLLTHCTGLTALSAVDFPPMESSWVSSLRLCSDRLTVLDMSSGTTLFSGRRQCIDSGGVTLLSTLCHNLVEINFCNLGMLCDPELLLLVTANPQLQSIRMNKCEKVTALAVCCIADHCPQLTLLNMFCCRLVTNDAIVYLSSKCLLLRSLDIGWCERVTQNTVSTMAAQSKRLTFLSLMWFVERKAEYAGLHSFFASLEAKYRNVEFKVHYYEYD